MASDADAPAVLATPSLPLTWSQSSICSPITIALPPPWVAVMTIFKCLNPWQMPILRSSAREGRLNCERVTRSYEQKKEETFVCQVLTKDIL